MPVGFMAQAVGGKLQIVFCHAGSTQLVAFTDDQSAQTANTGTHSQHDFSCPFAHAAAAPLPVLSGSETTAYTSQTEIILPADAPSCAIGPPRVVLTRGPPSNV